MGVRRAPRAAVRNEPAFLPYILQAEAQGRSPEEVAAATTATARAFFGLDRRGA